MLIEIMSYKSKIINLYPNCKEMQGNHHNNLLFTPLFRALSMLISLYANAEIRGSASEGEG
jgi:hypothetical protein